MSEDQNTPDPNYKVGPGRPPLDKRFKKNAPSPNPLGRPPKPKTQDSLFRKIDSFAATVSRFDDTMLRMRDDQGNMVEASRIEVAMQALYKKGVMEGEIAHLKFYLLISKEVRASREAYAADMLMEAVTYRQKHLVQFERYEAAGRPLPEIYPDPRDVIIHEDGSVTVEGPIDKEGRAQQAELLLLQQARLDAIGALQPYKQGSDPQAVKARKVERKLKRELAGYNKALSPRLRRHYVAPTIVDGEEIAD